MASDATPLGTIVVVEDDPNIADLLDMYLRQAGYRVIQATTGEAGLAAIDRERPRLAILDVGLPGTMDGMELCRAIRSRSSLPVIMLTARDGEIDRVLGLEFGADDYVTKPFSPREIVARVKAILRRTDQPHKDARGAKLRRTAKSSHSQTENSICSHTLRQIRGLCCHASNYLTECGESDGTATNARWMCMCANSARSSAMRFP
jgi:DNA-binding response OmpR family regulator